MCRVCLLLIIRLSSLSNTHNKTVLENCIPHTTTQQYMVCAYKSSTNTIKHL